MGKRVITKCHRISGFLANATLVAILFLNACGGVAESRDYPLGNRIANAGEIVQGIRRGLGNHASSITIRFDYGEDILEEVSGCVDAWVEEALAETEEPTEGDYIRYQYGGYQVRTECRTEEGRRFYTVTLRPEYYCYLTQEEEAATAAEALGREFGFRRSTSDREKIEKIYDWLCTHVIYDKVHNKYRTDHLRSTAYAALVRRTATCQGYSAALYRLLRQSGVNCRIVTGSAGEDELHAWVIAELDGFYYHLDPTWDAGQEEYRYFLVGTRDLADHVLDAAFTTEDFLQRYPMASESALK